MYLLKESIFCEQLARFLKPELFTNDFIRKAPFGPSTRLSGIIESKIQIWTPTTNMEATFTITNLYSKIYRSEVSETGWRECDAEDIKRSELQMTETVYTFNVIAREDLKVTEERFRKTLSHYRLQFKANCLLVRSIKVDNLPLSEIQKTVTQAGYGMAVWDVILR